MSRIDLAVEGDHMVRLIVTDEHGNLFAVLDPGDGKSDAPSPKCRLYFGQPGDPNAQPPVPPSFRHVEIRHTTAYDGLGGIEYRLTPRLSGTATLRGVEGDTQAAALVMIPGTKPESPLTALWRPWPGMLKDYEVLTPLEGVVRDGHLADIAWPPADPGAEHGDEVSRIGRAGGGLSRRKTS